MAYRIRIANYYAVGGRVDLVARDETGEVLTFAAREDAASVMRDYDPYDGEVYEVKRGRVNATADSRIPRDFWSRWENS